MPRLLAFMDVHCMGAKAAQSKRSGGTKQVYAFPFPVLGKILLLGRMEKGLRWKWGRTENLPYSPLLICSVELLLCPWEGNGPAKIGRALALPAGKERAAAKKCRKKLTGPFRCRRFSDLALICKRVGEGAFTIGVKHPFPK